MTTRHRYPHEKLDDRARYRSLGTARYQAVLARHRAWKRQRRIARSRALWADARLIVAALHARGLSDHAIRERTGIPHPCLRRVFREMADHEHIRDTSVRKLADLLVRVIDAQAPKLPRGRPGKPIPLHRLTTNPTRSEP